MQITMGELFTTDEIKKAGKLYNLYKGTGNLNKVLAEQIVEPVMYRIDAKTGQRNSPAYLAYALEYVLNEMHSIVQPDGPESEPLAK